VFECGRLSRPCVRTEQSEEPRVRSGRIYLALNRRADSERLARIAPLDSAPKNSHVSDLFGVKLELEFFSDFAFFDRHA
jgi:hypothetical protein